MSSRAVFCLGRGLWHGVEKGDAMRKSFLATAALAGMAAMPAAAEYPWRMLGQRDLNVEGDGRQVIAAPADQRFTNLRLCVSRQPILIHQMEVRFREGGSRIYQLRTTLQNQRCTADIVLSGGARELAGVTVSYNPAGLSHRGARLQLHAR
jgi:hypothetical protein